jgi:hypothetical protein
VTRLGWWFTRVLARALEPEERDIVLGDLVESGEGLGPAMRDLLGLIVRRQAGLWLSYEPWVALLGVSCLAGLPLSGIALDFNGGLYKYTAGYATSFTDLQEVAFLVALASALVVWSWTCGFVLGSFSGRAVWLTWSAFYLVVQDSSLARAILTGGRITEDRYGYVIPPLQDLIRTLPVQTLPLSLQALLLLFAALFGAFVGARRRVLTVPHAYLLGSLNAAFTILLTFTIGSYYAAHLPRGFPVAPWSAHVPWFLLASWPAAFLLVAAYRHRNEKEATA